MLPGIRAVAAHGHTALRLDLEHDADAILLVRQRSYAEAAAQGYLIGAAPISFPGLGRLRADGQGYQWLPLIHASQP